MTTQEVLREIERVFIEEAESDFVGLWLLAKLVNEYLPSLNREAIKGATLTIIGLALEQGRLVPGEFVDMKFVPWNYHPLEALDRIDKAWSALGREPDIGEIVWFVAPSAMPGPPER